MAIVASSKLLSLLQHQVHRSPDKFLPMHNDGCLPRQNIATKDGGGFIDPVLGVPSQRGASLARPGRVHDHGFHTARTPDP